MKNIEKASIYQKIVDCSISRYTVSKFCFCQLQHDNIRFNKKFVNDFSNSSNFLCRILCNYILYTNRELGGKTEKELVHLMKQPPRQQKDDYKGRFSLNNELREHLTYFDFVKGKTDYPFQFSINKVLSYLLECYARHTLAEREKIYFYKEYTNAVFHLFDTNQPEILEVKHMSGKIYEMKPYKCEIDDNSFSYYLIGYSRNKGSDDAFRCATIRLDRIISCTSTGKMFSFDRTETEAIDRLYTFFGAAYIPCHFDPSKDEIKPSVVQLTKYGYEVLFLDRISYQRPIPCKEPEKIEENGKIKYYRLTFQCSHRQIQNYFFAFGKEAFVIQPDWINTVFAKRWENGFGCSQS